MATLALPQADQNILESEDFAVGSVAKKQCHSLSRTI